MCAKRAKQSTAGIVICAHCGGSQRCKFNCLNMIRVAIADDHSLLRQAWVFILSRIAGISIVAECANGEEAITAVQKYTPDIILMDINMEPMNGIQAAERISKQYPRTRIIAMSVHKDMSYVNRMLRAGASGFVTKNSPSEEMVEAIKLVNKGQTYLCEEIRASYNSPDRRQGL